MIIRLISFNTTFGDWYFSNVRLRNTPSRKLSSNSDCNIINNSPISNPITDDIDLVYPRSETKSDRINRYNEIKTKMKKEWH